MKKIEIYITEKDKMGRQLTLLNFRDELVNFMYKKTVADSSRTSMGFFVLIFFLSLKVGQKSLLMSLFDDNADKLKSLNEALSSREKLRSGEYAELIKNIGLDRLFKYDIFFILITCILDSDRIFTKFNEYFSKNSEVRDDFIKVVDKYKNSLGKFESDFKSNLIADDRIDEEGEYHDLSKSVYRTIKMRTSRSLDIELHKYAEVKIIKSESPICLTITQHIDPQIIIDLWNTYKLGDYVKAIWQFMNNGIPANFIGGALVIKYVNWKTADGNKNRRIKANAKAEFDAAKNNPEQNIKLMQLVEALTESVIKSNEYLQNEVRSLKRKREATSREIASKAKDKKIKELEEKIRKLENIKVDVSEAKSR